MELEEAAAELREDVAAVGAASGGGGGEAGAGDLADAVIVP